VPDPFLHPVQHLVLNTDPVLHPAPDSHPVLVLHSGPGSAAASGSSSAPEYGSALGLVSGSGSSSGPAYSSRPTFGSGSIFPEQDAEPVPHPVPNPDAYPVPDLETVLVTDPKPDQIVRGLTFQNPDPVKNCPEPHWSKPVSDLDTTPTPGSKFWILTNSKTLSGFI
jgi:hypothetical protein